MAKKKNKHVILPWCWYCEREFEDEKVLMQHQKAKHFKCTHCPRRLNTAGGLAVHVQQVHKLDPDKIENALPGRDGYDVEIFGMEGIPAPDLADYRRRKEAALGLAPGSITQPPPSKRPRVENKVLSETELAAQLAAHRALMGGGADTPATEAKPTTAVFSGAAETYAAPPAPVPPPAGFPPFVPGMPPPFMPPFPPPPGMFPGGPPPFAPAFPGAAPPFMPAPPPTFVPASATRPMSEPPEEDFGGPRVYAPNSNYTNPPLKEGAQLVWADANLSSEEKRAMDGKYVVSPGVIMQLALEAANAASAGKKRARAEDYL